MNIYTDFLSREEIEFITQCKQKNPIKRQLNSMGIPFKENANGFPVVRRDYAQAKQRKPIATNDSDWTPNALKA
ncbi:TPA: DUF4224 domain-containing protein [Mannheimia haemolytica]|uniref:DUF4224 domain-containing protein n=1 Tax=Mannheimia haemolytica TaxID=75985 RepID=UPI0001BCFC48|nr:DUF4224 domain-containing protein [Mannheimia haemolytica]EEY11107.1 hypothetical protein COI_0294 [Mannheimia haemolytica serotype A2 str. OVINE]HDL5442634.1 DUF4224 domain-containing protein [Mannheimia haemolytica]HDZ6747061.1 DUF4224 domain-containing protein [Mannheimia haemolytica]HDZ6814014.1 DUF4224 domain-containing protein [Mannheimia haemolytica]